MSAWREFRKRWRDDRRRGVVAVQVAVMSTVLAGFAALTVDVGAMYNAKADLQRTADAAALAAVSRLADYTNPNFTATELATQEAIRYAAANGVMGRQQGISLSESDIEFGKALYNPSSGSYEFVPTSVLPDAVRVKARLTSGSLNGPLALHFARVFGANHADISAEAIAMMIPRDIAIVADLSASHNDDSELRNLHNTKINLFDVWANLPISKGRGGVRNGVDPAAPGAPNALDNQPATGAGIPGHAGGNPNPDAEPFDADDVTGPRWGWMTGYGSNISYSEVGAAQTDYNPTTDIGLYDIRRGVNTTDPAVIANLIEAGYTSAERQALLSGALDNQSLSHYRNRVAALLGLKGWRSKMVDSWGRPNSKYTTGSGNGNVVLDDSEMYHQVAYPFPGGSWNEYIDYVRSNSEMTNTAGGGDSRLKNRYGIKTFVNYLLEKRPGRANTPELANTPHQPMQAVKNAVAHLVQTLYDLDSDDQLSLEVYDQRGRHEVDLRDREGDYYEVSSVLDGTQAGEVYTWTNMGAGILRARQELASGRARPNARKVMFLLTDGYANVASEFGAGGDYAGGRAYALQQAAAAAAEGIQIFAVSVGSYSDTELMDEIARIGSGSHFHAEGSIEQYAAQLDEIFKKLGGRRPLELIH